MEHYVVTITRQFGSMGRPIAKKLAEELNIEFYDRDIVEETAKKMNLPISMVSEEEEKTRGRFFNMSYPLGMKSREFQDNIYNVQRNIIMGLVEEQSCIIVGRCSDAILENYENSFHIYIYAPFEARLKNCVEDLGMERSEAIRMITEVDKARTAYHKKYAKFSPDDVEHKNLMIDSSFLGTDGTVRAIAAMIRDRFKLTK